MSSSTATPPSESVPSSISEVVTESPVKGSRDGMSELSSSDLCVLVVGAGLSGCACALALQAAGCEVHVYEQNPEGVSSSAEVGVLFTEELQAFCQQHQLDLVS